MERLPSFDPEGFCLITRRDIPVLLKDETFVTAWAEWRRWKRFGLPKGSGWSRERPAWVAAVEICEQEYDLSTRSATNTEDEP